MPTGTVAHLKHLASILRRMDTYQAMMILSELKESSDPNALRHIACQLITPQKLFSELNNDELTLILKPLHPAELKNIIARLDQKNRHRFIHIIGKGRYHDVLNHERKETTSATMNALLRYLVTGVSDGRIAYDGIALLLAAPNCRRKKLQPGRETLLFQTLTPLVSPGAGIPVLIHAPGAPNTAVRLSLQTRRRFFDERRGFAGLTLDEHGFYCGTVYPLETGGPATLWLELSGGVVGRTVFFTPPARARLSVQVLAVERVSGEQMHLVFRCEGGEGAPLRQKTVQALLYCCRCGIPIQFSSIPLQDSIGHLDFHLPENSDHDQDFYLHIIADNHAGTRFNPHHWGDDPVPRSISHERDAGAPITIMLPAEPDERIWYHVSTSSSGDLLLRNLIQSGQVKPESLPPSNRKPSPLEMAVLRGNITLLAERRGPIAFGDFRYNEKGFVYRDSGIQNISDLYFTFYRITAQGVIPVYRYTSPVRKKPQLLPLSPLYIEKNEEVEMDIAYALPGRGTLTIDGTVAGNNLSGSGCISMRLYPGSTHRLSLQCEGHPAVEKVIAPSKREGSHRKVFIEYAPPGTRIPGDCDAEIFENLNTLYDYFVNQLISYPWGCAEQTAAKIALYCIKLATAPLKNTESIYIPLIKSGITHLLTFRNSEGHFSLFGDTYGPEQTAVVLANLAPLMIYRSTLMRFFPELVKLIDKMRGILNRWDENTPRRNQYLGYINAQRDLLSPGDILSTTRYNLRMNNNELKLISKGFFSLPAYCCQVLAALLDENMDFITVYAGKKITKNPMYRKGFPGFLERIHLLTPRFLSNEHITGVSLPNAREHLLRAITIAHPANSSPSTTEIMSMLLLLDRLKGRISGYRYRIRGKEVTVKGIRPVEELTEIVSPFTWLKRIRTVTPATVRRNAPAITLTNKLLRKGQLLRIRYSSNAPHYEIFHFLLPPMLRGAPASPLRIQDQSVITHPERDGELALRAAYRGKGYLKLLIENMYNPAEMHMMNLGLIEVI